MDLLTTSPVAELAGAVERLRWYATRWNIELYHRTLKSGCRIETRQLREASRLKAALAIDMVVAWRVFHLTELGRETPDLPCSVFFDEPDWQALAVHASRHPIPPLKAPALREALRMLARVGGFLGRKGDGEPGLKCIGIGLQRLDDMTAMWQVLKSSGPPSGEPASSPDRPSPCPGPRPTAPCLPAGRPAYRPLP